MPNKKKEISDSIKTNKKDVGSSVVQIAALSKKIDYLADHFKKNNSESYKNILIKLNLRK